LIIAKSINGNAVLFSIAINIPNDKEDMPKDNRTNEEFEILPVSNRVNPIKNVVIVIERKIPPFISTLFSFFLSKTSMLPFDCCCCCCFLDGTNIAIIVVTIAATGAIKKKVACQPIDWIILAPNKRPSTDPAEYAELNTPIAIESFFTGKTSLKILNATGTAAKPTP
jgi:hypothetical protein